MSLETGPFGDISEAMLQIHQQQLDKWNKIAIEEATVLDRLADLLRQGKTAEVREQFSTPIKISEPFAKLIFWERVHKGVSVKEFVSSLTTFGEIKNTDSIPLFDSQSELRRKYFGVQYFHIRGTGLVLALVSDKETADACKISLGNAAEHYITIPNVGIEVAWEKDEWKTSLNPIIFFSAEDDELFEKLWNPPSDITSETEQWI